MKIKHVYGNVLKLDIPLTIKIRTIEGDVPTEREEPFYPDTSKGCVVVLNNSYNSKMEYRASLNGNVAHIEDDGVIGIGTYRVTVKCYDEYGNPYRYMVRDIVEICDATIDAGIEAGVEFNAETYTLEGAVFVSYGIEQVQADWTETDIHAKAYIKNKPTNLVEDESYVHTDNNYTNTEKEKLADLENYDDSGIRQELNGKVDKVAGKGLSTNDFTNEDKSKLNSALQSETDPTVPSWAKQPQKPTYTAQEVGALPSDTPIPVVPTNVSAFINDAGYLTQHQDISGKADKVTSATENNFAGLDANGNLKDSGKKAADFATAAQGAKADTAIQSVKVNGTALTPDANKAVNVEFEIPERVTSAELATFVV